MGAITNDNTIFKSASFMYSKIKRDLSSYDNAGIIDEGEFPSYIKHVLKLLGLGVYKEKEAVVAIKSYKGCLPDDFSQLYSAYKCSPFIGKNDIVHEQGRPSAIYNDVSWALLQVGDNCSLVPEEDCDTKVLEKIVVRQYVREQAVDVGFKNFVPLTLSPSTKREFIGDDCINVGMGSVFEISIIEGELLTNFSQDHVYMKYYAFPKDENGVPEIPDIEEVEKAMEWCIKYELLVNMWMNNSTPGLENRWQYAEQQYKYWMSEAKKYLQLPSFNQMVTSARRNRSQNKVAIFAR